jgi:nucleotide-binding universal stress UspA family protein
MNLFKNILLVGASEMNAGVMEHISAVADMSGANLKVLKITEARNKMANVNLRAHPAQLIEWMKNHQRLQDAENNMKLQYSHLYVHFKALQGDPQEVVEREIEGDHHDLVVIDATHKNVVLNHLIISTAMHLMRNCSIPILLSRPEPVNRSNRILAAVDPMDCSGAFGISANALNQKIMALANDVAYNTGQKIHVLNCWRHPMKERLLTNEKLSDVEVHNVLLAARDQQKKCLVDFLKTTSRQQLRYRIHLRQGNPEQLIPSIAQDHRISLVIMGSIGRSGLDGLMVGNTAERILCHSNLSLLTVKPSNYQPVAGDTLTPAEAACEI